MVCFFVFFSTSVAKETENLNIWSKLNQISENTITDIMKVSVAGTSLKESEKKVYESLCKKNNSRKVKKIFQKPERSKKYVFLAKCIENALLRETYCQQNRGK